MRWSHFSHVRRLQRHAPKCFATKARVPNSQCTVGSWRVALVSKSPATEPCIEASAFLEWQNIEIQRGLASLIKDWCVLFLACGVMSVAVNLLQIEVQHSALIQHCTADAIGDALLQDHGRRSAWTAALSLLSQAANHDVSLATVSATLAALSKARIGSHACVKNVHALFRGSLLGPARLGAC